MLGETVHAYILTPALAIAVPRLHSSAACRGDWGEAVEPTAIAVGCKDIAPHGACRAEDRYGFWRMSQALSDR